MVSSVLRIALFGALHLTATACLPSEHTKYRNPTEPEELDDGWQIDTPSAVDLDESILEDIHDELLREDRHFGVLAFLVVKDDRLVFETYFRDVADRELHHHVQSMTKSVTSTAYGIALDEQLAPDLDAHLGEIFPSTLERLAAVKSEITIEQLLTMRSGIRFDNSEFSVEMWVDRPGDPLRHMLEKPMYADPGERFYYRDMDPQILGYVIQDATGMSQREWVEERIFDPLGIEDFRWESGPGGVSMAAHGLHLRARDSAKLGKLWLNSGEWDGARLVSERWIEQATTTQVDELPGSAVPEDVGYGYLFWTLPEFNAFTAVGHGGQYILVAPDRDLVLVRVALPDAGDLHGSSIGDFVELVRPLLE